MCVYNVCVDLRGGYVCVDLGTNSISLANKTFSISFWAKFNTAPSGSNQFFCSQGVLNQSSKNFAIFYESAGNNLRFSFWGGGYDMDTNGYNMTTFLGTTWHHYVITFNNTTRAGEIWVDNQKSTTNISNFSGSFTGSGDFYIAKSGTYNNPFNGLMEDFRIYDKVLTPTEIGYLANNMIKLEPQPIYETQTTVSDYTVLDCDSYNLKAHYKFDGTTNEDLLTDSSGNGNHLTIGGGDPSITETEYVIGQSANLLEEDAYLEIPSTTLTMGGGPFSIAFWLKIPSSSQNTNQKKKYDRYGFDFRIKSNRR